LLKWESNVSKNIKGSQRTLNQFVFANTTRARIKEANAIRSVCNINPWRSQNLDRKERIERNEVEKILSLLQIYNSWGDKKIDGIDHYVWLLQRRLKICKYHILAYHMLIYIFK